MAAACWICLEEGNDGEGKPPVCDCSCRGDAAGYAHNSCIVEYAKVKSKQAKNDARASVSKMPQLQPAISESAQA